MTRTTDYTTRDLALDILALETSNPTLIAQAIDAAIAAAVAAEREACAAIADKHEHEAYVKKINADDQATANQRTVQQDMAQRIAAAIRARSNGAGRE